MNAITSKALADKYGLPDDAALLAHMQKELHKILEEQQTALKTIMVLCGAHPAAREALGELVSAAYAGGGAGVLDFLKTSTDQLLVNTFKQIQERKEKKAS